jgi:transposase
MPTLVDDQFWQLLEPLLPRSHRRYRHPGRKRLDDRKVLAGILFVLTTGIAWQRLPQELGYGSGMTCWLASPPRMAAGWSGRTLTSALSGRPSAGQLWASAGHPGAASSGLER